MDNHVLILHGWGDNSKSGFIPHLVNNLESKGYSPAALDLPDTLYPKFDEWFKACENEIKKFNNGKFTIVGHSMGGLLALKLAEKYKLNKLVLVAPVGFHPSEKYFDQFKNQLNEEELSIYKNFQNRDLDVTKIKLNSEKITFIFGLKDGWINQEIREIYINNFLDTSEIKILEDKAHMSESEGVNELKEVEELF